MVSDRLSRLGMFQTKDWYIPESYWALLALGEFDKIRHLEVSTCWQRQIPDALPDSGRSWHSCSRWSHDQVGSRRVGVGLIVAVQGDDIIRVTHLRDGPGRKILVTSDLDLRSRTKGIQQREPNYFRLHWSHFIPRDRSSKEGVSPLKSSKRREEKVLYFDVLGCNKLHLTVKSVV